eukprot:CAMPEP_0194079712 /NCGR_PEP_ID=MMETSP0149-20130528/5861_1 /TAXON_ID=122233 /ORGANISM="Chaetoceros debilis, Strain MM31A-1" /LENGTH=588 /DNA_ID=CAMNT_0038761267 /DNA_START=176 /DNA_END=1939 /DNA_ORIENTATION=+
MKIIEIPPSDANILQINLSNLLRSLQQNHHQLEQDQDQEQRDESQMQARTRENRENGESGNEHNDEHYQQQQQREEQYSCSSLHVDPRVIGRDPEGYTFQCRLHYTSDNRSYDNSADNKDIILTIRRTDNDEEFSTCAANDSTVTPWQQQLEPIGWRHSLHFRLYNSNVEPIPAYLSGNDGTINHNDDDDDDDSEEATIYVYHGLPLERAPHHTTIGIIHPSVTTIHPQAFYGCIFLHTCHMMDSVKRIERQAFYGCISLKFLRLSRGLVSIGEEAFRACSYMDAMFLPWVKEIKDKYERKNDRNRNSMIENSYKSCQILSSSYTSSLTHIGDRAFDDCNQMRFLVLPPHINLKKNDSVQSTRTHDRNDNDNGNGATNISCTGVGDGIVRRCDALLIHDHIQYTYNQLDYIRSNELVSHWMKHHLDDTPLLRLCGSASVTMTGIRQCLRKYGKGVAWDTTEHGLTALHLLVLNPNVTSRSGCDSTVTKHSVKSAMLACHFSDDNSTTSEGCAMLATCFHANPMAAMTRDGRGMTPLDYMWEYGNVEGIVDIVQSLTLQRQQQMQFETDANYGRRNTRRTSQNATSKTW